MSAGRDSAIARSRMFSSSRTLPGNRSASSAAAPRPTAAAAALPLCRASRASIASAISGMSSRHLAQAAASSARSRSAGRTGPGGSWPASTSAARFWWVARDDAHVDRLLLRSRRPCAPSSPGSRAAASPASRSGRSATSSRNSVPPLRRLEEAVAVGVGAGEGALAGSRRTRSPSGSRGSRRSSPATNGCVARAPLQVDQARGELPCRCPTRR